MQRWSSGRAPSCAVCGLFSTNRIESVLNFERFKWGGVRHLDPTYAAFDLERLAVDYQSQEPANSTVLADVLRGWQSLPATARAGDAAAALRGAVRGNEAERRVIVEILCLAGVLRVTNHDSMTERYVTYEERNAVHPAGRTDWPYPAFAWRGKDGVNLDAVAALWPALAGSL